MIDGGQESIVYPPCSTSLAKGLNPVSAKEQAKSLDSANQFAREKATIEMCHRCLGEFGITCILPGPQHLDQDIIPDLTPEMVTNLKAELPPEVKMWVNRILRGKTDFIKNPRIPGKHNQPDIIRTALFKYGYPQIGNLVLDPYYNLILSGAPEQEPIQVEDEPIDPATVIPTPSHDQARGVSSKVLVDLGWEPTNRRET